MSHAVVLAMTTYYQDGDQDPRSRVALETIQIAEKRGYKAVIVDGGTPGDFMIEAQSLRATVLRELPHKRGVLGIGRRQALAEAGKLAGSDGIVVWTEEKPRAIDGLNTAIDAVSCGKFDVVIPNRGDGLKTYPPAQTYAEQYGNAMWNLYFSSYPNIDTTNGPLDWWIGIRVMNVKALQWFLNYNGRFGDKWDSIFVPVIVGAFNGCKVGGSTLDVPYVYEQPWEVDNPWKAIKSLTQLDNLVNAGQMIAKEHGQI